MGAYKKYPEYIDSNLAWLGEMPLHWELRKSKFLFNRMQRQIRDSDGVVTAFRDGQVTLRTKRRTDGFTQSVKEIGYQGVRVGDLLVHAMDGFAGAIGVSDSDGKCSPVCSVCVPVNSNQMHIAYYGYLVRQLAVTDFISSLAKGIRERSTEFRYSEFSALELAVPSLQEQIQIANFLDHETTKIDTLIDKQQQLIALLKEKRQAVISHAVTKGLNPNAPMRDSGVEWLGKVPAHWTMPKVSYIGRVLNGSTPDKTNLYYWENGTIPWLASGCLNSEVVDEPSLLISESAYQNSSVELIPVDSLLVGMVGQGKTRGTSAILAIASCINQNMAAIIPQEKIQTRFLYYLFQAMYDDLRELGRGGNQAALNCEIIGSIRIVLPPTGEQKSIISYIDKILSKLVLAEELGVGQIELLRERRSSLISAAVTGKIDVRNWQAPITTNNKKEVPA